MIGMIGTAPKGEGVLTITPGSHGGNMDCNKIKAGTTLYLPVNVPGALLSMGDLHARMGDGEVLICGLETAGVVTVRVSALKGKEHQPLFAALPLLHAKDRLMTIQSGKTMDEAAVLAAGKMQQLVKAVCGLTDEDSGMLMSLLGDLVICQIVNPLKTVRCEFPVSVMEGYRKNR